MACCSVSQSLFLSENALLLLLFLLQFTLVELLFLAAALEMRFDEDADVK